MIPRYFEQLALTGSRSQDPVRRRLALERLASLYAALGLYERAIRLDRRALRRDPDTVTARRRLVWSLLRLGRVEEALAEAASLAEAAPKDEFSQHIVAAARRYATLADEEEAAALVARLPVFTPPEAFQLLTGLVLPEARTPQR